MSWFQRLRRSSEQPKRGVLLVPAGRAHATVMSALQALCFDERWPVQDIMDILSGVGAISFIAIPDGERRGNEDAPDRSVETAWRSLTGAVRQEPVGFILARATSGEAEILSVGVIPGARRMGAGAALLIKCFQEAQQLGAERLYLEVAEDNQGAIGLYHYLGFEQVGRRPQYYKKPNGTRVAALVMRKTLDI